MVADEEVPQTYAYGAHGSPQHGGGFWASLPSPFFGGFWASAPSSPLPPQQQYAPVDAAPQEYYAPAEHPQTQQYLVSPPQLEPGSPMQMGGPARAPGRPAVMLSSDLYAPHHGGAGMSPETTPIVCGARSPHTPRAASPLSPGLARYVEGASPYPQGGSPGPIYPGAGSPGV
jgi:hypothetical protein